MTEQKSRKHDPSYHVLRQHNPNATSSGRAGLFEHLTKDGAIKATSRPAAAKAVGASPDACLVIKAEEFQMFAHRVETKKIDLWEPLPDPPAALQPTQELPAVKP